MPKKILSILAILSLLTGCSGTSNNIKSNNTDLKTNESIVNTPEIEQDNKAIDEPLSELEEKRFAFSEKYNEVDGDNVFQEATDVEISDILNGTSEKKGNIIFIGNPDEEWSHFYVPLLNAANYPPDIPVYYHELKNNEDDKIMNNINNKLCDYVKTYGFSNEKEMERACNITLPTTIWFESGNIINYYMMPDKYHNKTNIKENISDDEKNIIINNLNQNTKNIIKINQ